MSKYLEKAEVCSEKFLLADVTPVGAVPSLYHLLKLDRRIKNFDLCYLYYRKVLL